MRHTAPDAAIHLQHRHSSGQVPRIVVTVAPVAHADTYLPDGCSNPSTPQEIAEEARRCADTGASVIHLHTREVNGAITSDMTVFRRTLDLVCGSTQLIINGSTGGASNLTREERCLSLTDERVELASLNMGSTNFGDSVYINTLADIRYWASRMREAGVVPELEVFAPGMVQTARELEVEGVLVAPLHFNICLGFPGSTPATVGELTHMAGLCGGRSFWGFLHEGMTDLRLISAALGLGASGLRVGYEDGGFVRADKPARSNAELVETLVTLIRAAGCEPATPDEAREELGLSAGQPGGRSKRGEN